LHIESKRLEDAGRFEGDGKVATVGKSKPISEEGNSLWKFSSINLEKKLQNIVKATQNVHICEARI
jgi:hypothetical protein